MNANAGSCGSIGAMAHNGDSGSHCDLASGKCRHINFSLVKASKSYQAAVKVGIDVKVKVFHSFIANLEIVGPNDCLREMRECRNK